MADFDFSLVSNEFGLIFRDGEDAIPFAIAGHAHGEEGDILGKDLAAEIVNRCNEVAALRAQNALLLQAAENMVKWADVQAGGRASRPEISALREAIETVRAGQETTS